MRPAGEKYIIFARLLKIHWWASYVLTTLQGGLDRTWRHHRWFSNQLDVYSLQMLPWKRMDGFAASDNDQKWPGPPERKNFHLLLLLLLGRKEIPLCIFFFFKGINDPNRVWPLATTVPLRGWQEKEKKKKTTEKNPWWRAAKRTPCPSSTPTSWPRWSAPTVWTRSFKLDSIVSIRMPRLGTVTQSQTFSFDHELDRFQWIQSIFCFSLNGCRNRCWLWTVAVSWSTTIYTSRAPSMSAVQNWSNDDCNRTRWPKQIHFLSQTQTVKTIAKNISFFQTRREPAPIIAVYKSALTLYGNLPFDSIPTDESGNFVLIPPILLIIISTLGSLQTRMFDAI